MLKNHTVQKEILRMQKSAPISRRLSPASLLSGSADKCQRDLVDGLGIIRTQFGRTTDKKWSQCMGRLVQYQPLTVKLLQSKTKVKFPVCRICHGLFITRSLPWQVNHEFQNYIKVTFILQNVIHHAAAPCQYVSRYALNKWVYRSHFNSSLKCINHLNFRFSRRRELRLEPSGMKRSVASLK
jgi:hypothetical protein